jgi:cell division protein FtsL
MTDFYDYIAVWLPIVAVALGFLSVAVVFSRGLEGIGRFEKFTRIFLSEGATLKTWGLFISCFTVSLLLSGIIAKLAADQSWPHDHLTAVARIGFFREVALGLLLLLAIVLGAFGAVAFKGQLGAANFQLNQEQVKHDQVQAQGEQLVTKAQSDAGAGAVGTVAKNAAAETKTHEITRDHYYEITKQPGAGDPVPQPVWDAFVRSVCLRASATGLPECDRLQKADP